jgi:putative FmdB family regulatory protein
VPLYDYICLECNREFEASQKVEDREKAMCDCGSLNTKLLITCNKRDWFRPHWNEQLDITPVYVESKEHYRKECEKRGLMARCLL